MECVCFGSVEGKGTNASSCLVEWQQIRPDTENRTEEQRSKGIVSEKGEWGEACKAAVLGNEALLTTSTHNFDKKVNQRSKAHFPLKVLSSYNLEHYFLIKHFVFPAPFHFFLVDERITFLFEFFCLLTLTSHCMCFFLIVCFPAGALCHLSSLGCLLSTCHPRTRPPLVPQTDSSSFWISRLSFCVSTSSSNFLRTAHGI